jgi:hypothetical protein
VLESNLWVLILGLTALNGGLTGQTSLDFDEFLLVGGVFGELAAEGDTLNWVPWAENLHNGINTDALVDLLNTKHLLKKVLNLLDHILIAL